MAAKFELGSALNADSLVLRGSGELDLTARQRVLDVALPALMGGRTVVLDLSNVTFIDAAGIGTLVTCAQAAVNSGSRFTIRQPQGEVAFLLKMTGVTQFIRDEPVDSPDSTRPLAERPPARQSSDVT